MLLTLVISAVLMQLGSVFDQTIYAADTNKIKLITKKGFKLDAQYTFDLKHDQIKWQVDFTREKSELPRLFALNIAGDDVLEGATNFAVNGKTITEDLKDEKNVFELGKAKQEAEQASQAATLNNPNEITNLSTAERTAKGTQIKPSYTYTDVATTAKQAIEITFTTPLPGEGKTLSLNLTPHLTENPAETTADGDELLPVDEEQQPITYVVRAKQPMKKAVTAVKPKATPKVENPAPTDKVAQEEKRDASKKLSKQVAVPTRPSTRAAAVGTAAIPTLLASTDILNVYKIKILQESFTNDTAAELANFNWYIKSTGTEAVGLGTADIYNYNANGANAGTAVGGTPGPNAQNLIGVNKQANITGAPIDFGNNTGNNVAQRRTGYHQQYASNTVNNARNNAKINFELSSGLFVNNNRGAGLSDNSLAISVSFGDVGMYYETPGSEGKKMGAIITLTNIKRFNTNNAWIDIPANLFSGVAYGNIDTLDVEYTFYEMNGDSFGRKLSVQMPPLNPDGTVNPADATWMTFGSLNNHSGGSGVTSNGSAKAPTTGNASVGSNGTAVSVTSNDLAEGVKKIIDDNDADTPDLKTVKAVGSLLRVIPEGQANAGYYVSSAMGIYTGHAVQPNYQGNDQRQFGDFNGAVDFEKAAVSFQVSGQANKFSLKAGSAFTWQSVSSGYARPITPKNPQKAVTALTTNPLDMVHDTATQKANNTNNRDTITNGSGNETLNFLPTDNAGVKLDLYDGIQVNANGNPLAGRTQSRIHFYDIAQPTYQNPNDSVAKPHTITLTDTLPLGIVPNLPTGMNLPTVANATIWTFNNAYYQTTSVSLWNTQTTDVIGTPTSTTHDRFQVTTANTRSSPVITLGNDGRYRISWTLTGTEISAMNFNGGEFIFRIPVTIDRNRIPDTANTAHQFLNDASVNFNLTDDTNEQWDWNGLTNQVRTRVSFPRGFQEVLTQIFVEKLWKDDGSWYAEMLRPTSIEMKVYQKIGTNGQWTDSGRIAQVTPSNDWRTSVSALPAIYQHANGDVDDIYYKVEEDNVPENFKKSDTGNAKPIERANINGPAHDGEGADNVTRTDALAMTDKDNNSDLTALIGADETFQNAFFVENQPEYDNINIGGYKYWQGFDGTPLDEALIPSEGITIRLYRNGVVFGEPIHLPRDGATGINRWRFEFRDLQRVDEKGSIINWDVSEDQVENFVMTKIVQSSTNQEFTQQIDFYNTKDASITQDTNNINVRKNWAVDSQVILPSNLWIMLYAQYSTKSAIPAAVIAANVPATEPTDTGAADYRYRLANYQNYHAASASDAVKLMVNRRALTAAENWRYTYENMNMHDELNAPIHYTMDEEVPRGFIMTAMTEEFSPDGTQTDIMLTNITNRTDSNGSITLNKIDQSSGVALANAYFRLEQSNSSAGDADWNAIGTKFSDTDGKIKFDALVSGRYRLTEIQAPSGFHLASGEITFEMERDVDGQIKIKAGSYRATGDLASLATDTTQVTTNQYLMKFQNQAIAGQHTYGENGAQFELQRGLNTNGTNAIGGNAPTNWATTRTNPGAPTLPTNNNRMFSFTSLAAGWYRLYQTGGNGYIQFLVNGENVAPSMVTYGGGIGAGNVTSFTRTGGLNAYRYQVIFATNVAQIPFMANTLYGGVGGTFQLVRQNGSNGTGTQTVTVDSNGNLSFTNLMTAPGTQTYRLTQTGAATGTNMMSGYMQFVVTRTALGRETISNIQLAGGSGINNIATNAQADGTSNFIANALGVRPNTGDMVFTIANKIEPGPFPVTGGSGVLGIVGLGILGAIVCYRYFMKKRENY